MFNGKRVFISGGAGVIGSELVQMLYQEGAIIFVGDLKPRPIDWPKEIIYRQGDLNFITKQELDNFSPEIFFHLAATFERSIETYEFWEENFHHNINLSHHLMTLLKDNKNLKKVIFASSYLIYNKELYNFEKPAPRPYSLKETDPISPRNLTGAAKLNHEIELNFLKEFKNLHVVNARIYRSYGKNSKDVISRWIRALIKNKVLTVFNKENVFDFVFAGDVAEGLLRLAKTDYSGVVNLATGSSRSIQDILTVLKKHFPKIKIKEVGQKILYEASQADMGLFKKLTGWTPPHKIEDAIPKIIEYEKEVGYREEICNFNILITSVAKKIGMVKAVKRAMDKLGNRGKLFGGDIDEDCIGQYFVDKFWKMPRTKDENLNKIISYCSKNAITLIIPSRDGELEFWAKHKEELDKEGITVMVSDYDTIKMCTDKLEFYKKLNSLGFPSLKTADSADQIDSKRFVVKERYGAGSKSMMLDISKKETKEHAKTLSDPIFQPFIRGKEYSVDLYVSKKKEVKGVIMRERNQVIDGESQITTTVNNKKAEKLCADIAKAINLFGHNIFQILIDEKSNIYIIECNARFGGASTLSIKAGLDSFYWLILESNGVDIADYPFIRTEKKLRQIRYPEDRILSV